MQKEMLKVYNNILCPIRKSNKTKFNQKETLKKNRERLQEKDLEKHAQYDYFLLEQGVLRWSVTPEAKIIAKTISAVKHESLAVKKGSAELLIETKQMLYRCYQYLNMKTRKKASLTRYEHL